MDDIKPAPAGTYSSYTKTAAATAATATAEAAAAADYGVEPKRELEQRNVGSLQRRLKARHIQFLALSGAIGTGLFVGSGQVLSLAGPLSAFLAYLITGANLYAVITSLGEMATWLPLPGAVPVYAARYVDPALGFTLGWNYWYQLAIGVPIEISASVLVIDYWPNPVPKWAWITIFLVLLVLLNCLPVSYYGEAEFVFGAIKLTTIVGLIILMFVIMLGGSPTHDRIGFRYWRSPGPMAAYLQPGALGRFLAFWKVFIQATFSYGGSEMVVIAAGETQNPRYNIPKAVRRVFWRILLFYVLAIFLVGMCVSSEDRRLLNALRTGAPGVGASPFVIAIANGGIPVLPHIINAVVLSSAFSAGNTFFYAATRVLYATALDRKAPAFLRFERLGVPYACVGVTTALSLLVYLNISSSASEVFFWISNISSVSTLLVWASISITYIRFYHGMASQGIPRSALPYRSPFQPYLAWFAVTFCAVVAFFNGFDAFFPGKFSAKTFIPPYINIPIFATLFLSYKFIYRTRLVPLHEMDFFSGKEHADRLESTWVKPVAKNFLLNTSQHLSCVSTLLLSSTSPYLRAFPSYHAYQSPTFFRPVTTSSQPPLSFLSLFYLLYNSSLLPLIPI
ncbi:amino acid permease, putative [Trichophyton benhamiae CBS 112371]|uniref:Amino acid permease, putative n=1 Tax=Arthroderma benhamiae (strain ATCC MYA-4681 / CBS 112371) TaxID=663331 RepID=D4AUM9_ARTBC|nr:amino acid permease, putative [Trichophyton benhamiae CBS 112371]EFE33194.1 amino acid permease, putative [Trichophyton benhamiae CBS 112371]